MNLWAFSGIMWAAQFSPGPDMLLLVRTALHHSTRAALATVLGIVTGLSIHCTLILGGLMVLLVKSPVAFGILRLAGALYLGWLGTRILLSLRQNHATHTAASPPLPGRQAFRQGLFTNLLNAKAILFLLTTLVSFHPPDAPRWWGWVLALTVLGQALVGWSAFVLALRWRPVREGFLRAERPLNFLFGLALLALGLGVLIETLRDHT